MSLFGPKGPMAPNNEFPPYPMREVARAQKEGRDATFHGACHGCAWKKGNSQGFGLQWCMGCAFFNFSEALPNLCTPMPRPDETLSEDY